ncbi:RICIN domain-containing protein [Actinoplanes sp. NPDC024001]|uniref:RICIN domain-containing protein n=1 Tax=Actinoplanes sp. NPDC024001 TaxID=3154598 RepID=UPI00340C9500
MKIDDHGLRCRALRLLRAVGAGLLAVAALCVAPAGAAHASTTIAATSTSGFNLSLQADNSATIAATLNASRVALTPAMAERPGKAGLCWPTPFNPGVGANGYCWDSADDTGSNGWSPQGFSVPHDAAGDGRWNSVRWEVTSWHNSNDTQIRLRFTNRNTSPPTYADVALVVFSGSGVVQRAGHADGVTWYGDKLYIVSGRVLDIVDLGDLTAYPNVFAGFDYVLPVRYTYRTTSSPCVPATGTTPCLNGVSFDRSRGALLTNEYYNADVAGGRLISWPLNLSTGLPAGTAQAAWTSPVHKMQGVTYDGASFFISGLCPSTYNNSYRQPACVHKGAAGEATSVLTQVPDMTQNLDWDASTGRVRGINEVHQSTEFLPQRLVFDFAPTARAITVGRFRNVNSNMCVLPYAASLNDGAYIVQAACDGKSAQNWYWNGAEMRSFVSDRCMTVEGASNAAGVHIIQAACTNSAYQRWTRVTGNGGAMLVNEGSGKCLVPYAGSKSSGANIMQGNCDATSRAYAWIGYTP